MLASWNITSHVYDDAQAARAVADISNRYIVSRISLIEHYLEA